MKKRITQLAFAVISIVFMVPAITFAAVFNPEDGAVYRIIIPQDGENPDLFITYGSNKKAQITQESTTDKFSQLFTLNLSSGEGEDAVYKISSVKEASYFLNNKMEFTNSGFNADWHVFRFYVENDMYGIRNAGNGANNNGIYNIKPNDNLNGFIYQDNVSDLPSSENDYLVFKLEKVDNVELDLSKLEAAIDRASVTTQTIESKGEANVFGTDFGQYNDISLLGDLTVSLELAAVIYANPQSQSDINMITTLLNTALSNLYQSVNIPEDTEFHMGSANENTYLTLSGENGHAPFSEKITDEDDLKFQKVVFEKDEDYFKVLNFDQTKFVDDQGRITPSSGYNADWHRFLIFYDIATNSYAFQCIKIAERGCWRVNGNVLNFDGNANPNPDISAYLFTLEKVDKEGSETNLNDFNSDTILISTGNNLISVNSASADMMMEIYTLSGQLLVKQAASIPANVNNGLYIVKITGANTQFIQKVLVK